MEDSDACRLSDLESENTKLKKLLAAGAHLDIFARRLPFFGNNMKIEASVLLGDRDEEVEVHGESDCWGVGRRRCGAAGCRDLQEARD